MPKRVSKILLDVLAIGQNTVLSGVQCGLLKIILLLCSLNRSTRSTNGWYPQSNRFETFIALPCELIAFIFPDVIAIRNRGRVYAFARIDKQPETVPDTGPVQLRAQCFDLGQGRPNYMLRYVEVRGATHC